MQTPSIAYSYIRFSSEKQHLGDSLRRQVAMAEAYALAHDMLLDTASYRDLGMSAFKGRNAVEGKLAMFLRALDADLIPPGVSLLVESLDRLSRNDVDDALNLFLSIIKRGVTIVTLTDGQIYNTKTIKGDRGISLIVSITIMMRAHEESATKSMRIAQSWKARTERGGILTTRCPSWLFYDGSKWRIDRKRAAIVRRIFRMYLAGDGCYRIHRALNSEGVPPLRKAPYWSFGIVRKLVHSKAVYGTMERLRSPDIEDYYPGIVSKDDFDRAQLLGKSRAKSSGGRESYPGNLYMGIGFCGGCGSRVQIVGGLNDLYTVRCSRANASAGCDGHRVGYRVSEQALLQDLLSEHHITCDTGRGAREAAARVKTLEAEQVTGRATLKKLIQLGLATSSAQSVAAQIVAIEIKLSDGQAQLAFERRAAAPKRASDLSEARHLSAAIMSGKTSDIEQLQMRAQLKALSRRVFTRIEFHPTLKEMTLHYESGVQSTVTYATLPQGFQKGHGGVARWGQRKAQDVQSGDRGCPSESA